MQDLYREIQVRYKALVQMSLLRFEKATFKNAGGWKGAGGDRSKSSNSLRESILSLVDQKGKKTKGKSKSPESKAWNNT